MSEVTRKYSRRRLRRAFYIVLLAALLGLTVSVWSWVDAQARAVVVISSVLDAPVLTPAVGATSGEPRSPQAPTTRISRHRSHTYSNA